MEFPKASFTAILNAFLLYKHWPLSEKHAGLTTSSQIHSLWNPFTAIKHHRLKQKSNKLLIHSAVVCLRFSLGYQEIPFCLCTFLLPSKITCHYLLFNYFLYLFFSRLCLPFQANLIEIWQAYFVLLSYCKNKTQLQYG